MIEDRLLINGATKMLKELFFKKKSSMIYKSVLIEGYTRTRKEIKYNSPENCCIQKHYGKGRGTCYFEKNLSNGIKDIIVVQDIKIIHILLLDNFLIYLQEYNKLIIDIPKNFEKILNDYNALIKESKENILIIANHISKKIPNEIHAMNNRYYYKSLKIKKDDLNKYTIYDDFRLYSKDKQIENSLEIIYGNLYKRKNIDTQTLYSENYEMFKNVNNPKNFNKVNLSFLHEPDDIFLEDSNLIEINFNNVNIYYLLVLYRKTIIDSKISNKDEHDKIDECSLFNETGFYTSHEYALIFKKNNEKKYNLMNLTQELISNDIENYKIMYKSKYIKEPYTNIIEYLINKDSYLQKKWIKEMYKTSLTTDIRELLGVSESGELNESEIELAKMFHF